MDLFSNLILAMKMFLISAGAVFVALGITVSLPAAVAEAPAMWSTVLSWMKPPYLYILINGIIITIVASSRFQQVRDAEPPARTDRSLISVKTPPPAEFAALPLQPEVKTVVLERNPSVVVYERQDRVVDLKPVLVNGLRVEDIETEEASDTDSEDDAEAEDPFVESASAVPLETIPPEFQLECPSPTEEKPPNPSAFGRRKTVEGVAAGNPAKHETLESVWKMIMEGRSRAESLSSNGDSPSASGVTREESSPRRDELNRRVEEFIQKINEDMRLQRQKSLDQYVKVIAGGAHY